jgi:hypothetical protein
MSDLNLRNKQSVNYVKSRQRVADHGEVFTPPWLVEAMLDLVKNETERIDSRWLEPACGSGNFLMQILRRKLAAVELKYGKSDFERQHYALFALMCIYGIELLPDNIAECRANLLAIFAEYLGMDALHELCRAASWVLSQNCIHGDTLAMRTHDSQPITFAEWSYLGNGSFRRRDFRLDALVQLSSSSPEGSPSKTYPPMTVSNLASAWSGDVHAEEICNLTLSSVIHPIREQAALVAPVPHPSTICSWSWQRSWHHAT